ncbi:Leucine Rich Repeat [Seminavis robusta]|uniref:Leucine Rich Repeat n=1 Tax=Seminavis robusta TaxID=568900 RepID=A0A9N8DYZ7_9STRA|nr:Leucine Rich Repeat [Seminavis robusta]|eukprot:Sro389_g132530.1 Leucine Rich Repeat (742) ;mRNA; r:9272-11591
MRGSLSLPIRSHLQKSSQPTKSVDELPAWKRQGTADTAQMKDDSGGEMKDDSFLIRVVQKRISEYTSYNQPESQEVATTAQDDVPRKASTNRQPDRPGAYSAAPGIELQRASTFVPSMIQSSSRNLLVEDDDEEAALSQPRLMREQILPTQPGAVAENGHNGDMTADNSTTEDSSSGLAVANLVQEDTMPRRDDLPRATDYNVESQELQREQRTKQFKTNVLLGVVVLVAVLMIVVAVAVPAKQSSNENSTQVSPGKEQTILPTAAPTLMSLEGRIKAVLPGDTLAALEKEGSPQAKAYQWLLDDAENLPLYTKERIQQKFVLATLYYTTSGDTWTKNTHWLNHSVHECDWFQKPDFGRKLTISKFYPGTFAGFLEPPPSSACDKDGRYQHLWLDSNNLVGSVPNELYMLKSLQTMSMGWNELKGSIASHIGQLTGLKGISLGNLLLTGTIPSAVGLLTNLEIISFRANQLSGFIPSAIWRLSNLKHLALGVQKLQGTLPAEIGALTKLERLIVDDCGLSGSLPTELGRAESLLALTLIDNGFTGNLPSEMGQLTALTSLLLTGNLLEGSLPTELGLATSLTKVFGGSNQFSGLPTEIGLLTTMMFFRLDDNLVSQSIPSELGLLTNLRDLKLQNTQFSGQIPSELGSLTSLGAMILANNTLSGTLPEELSFLQQSLHTMSLEGNPLLSGYVPSGLCDLNGTCIGNAFKQCYPPFGLSFDCTDLLCGCGCSCKDERSLRVG